MTEIVPVDMHHLVVPRTARFYVMGTIGASVRDVWIICHGYGQLAERFIATFREGHAAARLVVAPEALSRFYLGSELPHTAESKVGALWMTREDRESEITDIVSYLDMVYETILERLGTHNARRDQLCVHALGFSQGAAAVSRWVARGNAGVDHLVVWGSGIPDDVNLRAVAERRPEISVDLVYGEDDPWIRPEALELQQQRLRAARMQYRVRTYRGGHGIDSAMVHELFASESS